MADMQLAQRLKRAREVAGFSIREAADRVGYANYQTLSAIEKGDREVKASELALFSKAYFCDINSLLFDEAAQEPEVHLLWRQEPQEETRAGIEAYIRQRFEQYHLLEQLLGNEQETKFGLGGVSPEEIGTNYKINALAERIRKLLDLGSRPAISLQKVMEQTLGTKILFVDLGDLASAASTVHPSLGKAIIINSEEAPWRINFTLAHELFHIITWETFPPGEIKGNDQLFGDLEKKADRFASTLLLPGEEIRQELSRRIVNGKLAMADVVDVAREFGVSTQALLYRMGNLNIIAWEKAHEIANSNEMRDIDRRVRRGRREDKPISERFIIMAVKCLRKGLLSRGKFAELLEIERPDIDGIVDRFGLTEMEGEEIEIMAS